MASNRVLVTVDPSWVRGLESVMEDVVQRSGTKQDLEYDFMVETWDSTRRLRLSILPELEADTTTISQLFRDEHRLEHTKTVMEALMSTISDLHSQYKHRLESVSSQLSRGLALLPDELLEFIFDLAISCEGGGRRYAMRLSHVSQRFRRVVIGMKNLWSTLDSDVGRDELEECLSRSGTDSDLHIVTHSKGPHSTDGVFTFLQACQQTANRWTTIKICSEEGEEGDGISTLDLTLQHSFGRLQLSLPRLRELHIEQALSSIGVEETERFVPTWTSPNLQAIRCEHYVPLPSPSYSSITSFDLTTFLDVGEYNSFHGQLVTFLASTPNIASLCLTISTYEVLQEVLFVDGRTFPSIKSFTLNLPMFQFPRRPNSFLRSLLRSLRMPNLVDYSVSVYLDSNELEFLTTQRPLLNAQFLVALLPDHAKHPNLTSVTIDVESALSGMNERYENKWHLIVPLHCIPNVSTLVLWTSTRPRFIRTANGNLKDCRLKEVHFRGWKNLDRPELDAMLDSLEDVDAWEGLDAVWLEECDDVIEDDELMMVEGGEKIKFKRDDGTLRHIGIFN